MPARLPLLRSMLAGPRLVGLAFVLAAGLAAFAGASLVTAQRGGSGGPPAPEAYQGCVHNHTGVLRIAGVAAPCQPHETAIALDASGGDAALLDRIEALEATTASQQTLIETQAETITALQTQVPACLSTEGNEVYFTGCNVNIRSGGGSTNGALNGLGNLIVGYNEADDDTRTGSHNLVIGPYHSYSSVGGLVAGTDNAINGIHSSVSGGTSNTAEGSSSSVSGGISNIAEGPSSSVSGGQHNEASGNHSSISGGLHNTASGGVSSVSGGRDNVAFGDESSVAGGGFNTVRGAYSSVSGGNGNLVDTTSQYGSISGGLTNTVTGNYSSVSGGYDNVASGDVSSVSGGYDNVASGVTSSVGGGTALDADETFEFLPFTP